MKGIDVISPYEGDTNFNNNLSPSSKEMPYDSPNKPSSGNKPLPAKKQFSSIDEASEETSSSEKTEILDESDESSIDGDSSPTCVTQCQNTTMDACRKYSSQIVKVVLALCLIGYTVYFAFAIKYSVEGSKMLIYLTCLTVFCILYVIVRDTFGATISRVVIDPISGWIDKHWSTLKW